MGALGHHPLPPGLRDAREDDRSALLDLWVAAWRDTMPGIDFEARRPWLAAHLAACAGAGGRSLVAEVRGVPAGFMTLDPTLGHIDQVAVHPGHWGAGVADLLLDGAKALCPAGLDLDVNAANGRARHFYARHGFTPVSAGINALSGLPTLLMRWCGEPARDAVDGDPGTSR